MNASENSPPADSQSRLQRIKVVSRIGQALVLTVLVFNLGFSLMFSHWFSASQWTLRGGLMLAFNAVLLVWFWQWFQLFGQYGRGKIFDAPTIRRLKFLGALWIVGWLLVTAEHFVATPATTASTPLATSTLANPGSHPVSVVKHSVHFGFFSFDFGTGLDFGGLFAGAVIVIVAWIMDEGRKIKEEQELTV
jgi:protein-S-isoprenylcysteine O-methyltransferase Ste14